MKKVYICHQYYEPGHYKALYDCAGNYGYQVMDIIVLNPASAVRYRENLIKKEGLEIADKWYENNFVNQGKLWLLRDEIVIIGVAPYDRLLAQYQDVLRKNYSIYMTSWMDWHSGDVPYPYQDNKSAFMETLKNHINGVACVSAKSAQEVSCWNGVTQVVNHSIRTDEYKKKSSFKRIGKYLFLGRLEEIKNIKVIIRFLEEYPEKNIRIDLAGNGTLRETLEKYAAKDKRVQLLGHLSKDEIKSCLCKYDYLLLPSHQESFGIVLLEALACGVPCIVSNAVGPMEIISHNETGIIFDHRENGGFAKAINYSMDLEEEQYKIMSNNAMLESKKYDVSEAIKKWVALFKKVCGD